MAEQKIQAGKTIDTVTKRELHDALGEHLRSWVAETAAGGKFVRFYDSAAVASTVLDLDGVGPGPGFVWDVRRLRITGLGNADVATLYINDTAPSSTVCSTTDLGEVPTNRFFTFDRQLVLYPGDTLKVYGTGLAATGTISISGQALELPIGLGWKLS